MGDIMISHQLFSELCYFYQRLNITFAPNEWTFSVPYFLPLSIFLLLEAKAGGVYYLTTGESKILVVPIFCSEHVLTRSTNTVTSKPVIAIFLLQLILIKYGYVSLSGMKHKMFVNVIIRMTIVVRYVFWLNTTKVAFLEATVRL